MPEPSPDLPLSGAADFVTQLRAAGDPLHLLAAEALRNLDTTAERLQTPADGAGL